MDSQKVKAAIIKGMKAIWKPILAMILTVVILVSLFWGVIDGIFSNAAKIFSDIVDNIGIDGNNLVIDEEYMREAKERLKKFYKSEQDFTYAISSEGEYFAEIFAAYINDSDLISKFVPQSVQFIRHTIQKWS